MIGLWFLGGMLFVALVGGQTALAGDATTVAWHRDVQDAWNAARQQGRPMLVFVTRGDCYYCTQMKDRTYANATVAGIINQSFVPLVLDGGQNSPLAKLLGVTRYPTTVVISPDAVVLARLDGFVAEEAMCSRLNSLRSTSPVAKVAKVVKDP
jgi:uncharacterized protein YyaL (SSP411 family)